MDVLRLYIGYFGLNNLGDDMMLYHLTTKNAKNSFVLLQGDNYYDFVPKKNQYYNKKKHPVILLIFDVIIIVKLKRKGLKQVVFGGGTQFSETSSLFTQLKQLIIIIFCKLLFIKVTAESVGVGRVYNKKSLLNLILKLIDFISVRDKSSSEKLKLINKQHTVTKDIIYDIKFVKSSVKKETILITGTGSVLKSNKVYLANFIDFVRANIKNDSSKLVFCVFQKGEDEFLYECLKKYFPKLKIDTLNMDINKISTLYSKTSFVVGMRYHSLILADIFNIPFSGFSYDDKVKDLCHIKNMSFYKA